MNLAAAIELFAFGTSEGAEKGWDTRGRGRKFVTKTGRVGGYFKPGAIAAKLYEDLAANEGSWLTRKELREKYQVGGLLQALTQLQRAGVEKGKWAIEFAGNKSMVRLVFKRQQDVSQGGEKKADTNSQEYRLFHLEIIKKSGWGGGITDSYKVTLKDGTQALMKYPYPETVRDNIPKGGEPAREAAAWELAKLVGLEDLVPPTVKRTLVGGKDVSIQLWSEGATAKQDYDGIRDRVRAAAFDYVIGNEDRHRENWLSSQNGKIVLIDNGLSLPTKAWNPRYNSSFVRNLVVEDMPVPPSKSISTAYTERAAQIDKALEHLGIEKEAREGVQQRIRNLSNATSWKALPEIASYLEANSQALGRWGAKPAVQRI